MTSSESAARGHHADRDSDLCRQLKLWLSVQYNANHAKLSQTSQDITRHHSRLREWQGPPALVYSNLSKLRDDQQLRFSKLKRMESICQYLKVYHSVAAPHAESRGTQFLEFLFQHYYNMQWLQCSHPNLWLFTGCGVFSTCGRRTDMGLKVFGDFSLWLTCISHFRVSGWEITDNI
jgi:hypothetical protein